MIVGEEGFARKRVRVQGERLENAIDERRRRVAQSVPRRRGKNPPEGKVISRRVKASLARLRVA